MAASPGSRPKISLSRTGRGVLHNGDPCRIVFESGLLRVGCSDITIEAAEYLLREYKKAFPETKEVVLQEG